MPWQSWLSLWLSVWLTTVSMRIVQLQSEVRHQQTERISQFTLSINTLVPATSSGGTPIFSGHVSGEGTPVADLGDPVNMKLYRRHDQPSSGFVHRSSLVILGDDPEPRLPVSASVESQQGVVMQRTAYAASLHRREHV